MGKEPKIDVGLMEERSQVKGWLKGPFRLMGRPIPEGEFAASSSRGLVLFRDTTGEEHGRQSRLVIESSSESTFGLSGIVIGRQFHWERPEDQEFSGDLILTAQPHDTVTVIDRVPAEEYLKSVISSEMSAQAPSEFLKTHAILSRSWLLASVEKRRNGGVAHAAKVRVPEDQGEVIRWYDREDHDLFDVCADDHCQRYHGITKITSREAEAAVEATRGMVLTSQGEICDARYSKACGGQTEVFSTAWHDGDVPYLKSVTDGEAARQAISTEEEAERWIMSEPDAYCNVRDPGLLQRVLPDFDRETASFFRWNVDYDAHELSALVREKSGIDFGEIKDLVPLTRGASGRISRLRIIGSKATVVVGKELEIRRWLSKSHLYSSAFLVKVIRDRSGHPITFSLRGAGWGHGVGLCQIGAAAMADQGFVADRILAHYFCGAHITKIYD